MLKASFLLLIGILAALRTSAAMPLLGGVTDAKIDAHTEDVAKFAVSQLNGKSNFPKEGTLQLGKVVSAKSQVVAGINHILTIETKDDSGATKTVEVTVWEKPAYNQPTNEAPMELTNFKVQSEGAQAESSDEWSRAAEQALAQINQRSNSLFPYKLHEVLQVTPKEGGAAELLLSVQRGDRIQETYKVNVHKHGDDHFALASFEQQQQEPAAE